MALQLPNFRRISFDEANPMLVGLERGQKLGQGFAKFPLEMQQMILANKIKEAEAKYAEPMAASGLKTAQQHNEFDPRIWQSEIGLRGAQAGLAGSEANKNRFLVNNPQYMSPEGMLISQAMEAQKHAMAAQQNQNQGEGSYGSSPSFSGGGQQPSAPPAQQQLPQPNGPQYSKNQYNSDALAFNPPSLPSPTGNIGLDSLYYKKFGMDPIMQTQMDLSKSQAEKYQQQNIERNKEFNNQSVFANESTLNAHKFLDALERSSSLERGYLGGHSPAISSASQEMETYGANMAAAATKLFQGNNAVHAADIELQQMAKPNRKQNENVSFDLAQGVIAKNDRMKEKQQFYAQGTQLGLKPEIMDSMWNKYETDRPYISSDTKMPNDAFKGTWRDYLHPEAVNEFLRGKDFNFPNQKKLEKSNWSSKDLEHVKSWAKKNNLDPKDFSKKNLYKLAKSEHLTLAELKEELHEMGAI